MGWEVGKTRGGKVGEMTVGDVCETKNGVLGK